MKRKNSAGPSQASGSGVPKKKKGRSAQKKKTTVEPVEEGVPINPTLASEQQAEVEAACALPEPMAVDPSPQELPDASVEVEDQNRQVVPAFTRINDEAQGPSNAAPRPSNNWPFKVSYVSPDIRRVKKLSKMLCLDPRIKRILAHKLHVQTFFPVQRKVVKWLIEDTVRKENQRDTGTVFQSNDLCVCSPTGSGKTLAYVVPLMQALMKRVVPKLRAIILVPVQELALQISNIMRVFCHELKLSFAVSVGGGKISLTYNGSLGGKLIPDNELVTTYTAIDILITTPGKLMELISGTNRLSLKALQYIILDEADRLLDGQQNHWVNQFLTTMQDDQRAGGMCPPQKMLFSATLTQDPTKLNPMNLFRPTLFTTETNDNQVEGGEGNSRTIRYVVPPLLTELYVVVDPENKPAFFQELMNLHWKRILCFTKSCIDSNRLSKLLSFLNPGMPIFHMSSSISPTERRKNLDQFSQSDSGVLISSDLVARGIDIPNVDLVVSYDAPKHPKGYIHRVGRTGRAQNEGTAITLLSQSQVGRFNEMLFKVQGASVTPMVITPRTQTLELYESALQWLMEHEMTERASSARLRKMLKRRRRFRH